MTKQFGVKVELMENPIMVQLAQGIARPSLNAVLSVTLFCRRVWFFENFTLCDLNNFNVIVRNTFLDAYEVDILCSGGKLRIHAKCGSKLVNLNVDYNSALTKMGVKLVALASELESLSFWIWCFWKSPRVSVSHKGRCKLLFVFWIHSIIFWSF